MINWNDPFQVIALTSLGTMAVVLLCLLLGYTITEIDVGIEYRRELKAILAVSVLQLGFGIIIGWLRASRNPRLPKITRKK